MDALRGKNVLVLGLGVNQGGAGVARYLVEQGAQVRVTDMQDAERLAPSLEDLADLPISYTLGGHEEEDIAWAQIVVRNPGVPRESKWLAMARELGAQVEMEMTLFFRACPSPIIGVTGTKGKTTTTTIIGTILRTQWPEARIAGNMGRSAVLELSSLQSAIPVVLELSSFQIEGLSERGRSPHIAVITNIAEDHLDRYPSFDAYAKVKADLARFQSNADWLIYPGNDARLAQLVANMSGRPVNFGLERGDGDHALWIDDDRFVGRWGDADLDFGPVERLPLPGIHAQMNALVALAAVTAAGVPHDIIRRALAQVRPVPDRLEPVATIGGVEYVNDTTATVPVAAIAALRAFDGRSLIVIAGGSEKHLALDDFATELAGRAKAIVLLEGDATPRLRRLLPTKRASEIHGPYRSMTAAVDEAAKIADPGDVVLLSPGCASFGMFQNEFDRGRQFREAVKRIQLNATGVIA